MNGKEKDHRHKLSEIRDIFVSQHVICSVDILEMKLFFFDKETSNIFFFSIGAVVGY